MPVTCAWIRMDSSRPAPTPPVLGDGGPISVPPHASVLVGGDGTISIVPLGQGPETRAVVGRIKLVNPANEDMARGTDGLFRLKDGTDAPADATTRVGVGRA